MRAYTVLGIVADQLGHARNPASQLRSWTSPASQYRTVQAERIPIDANHDGRPSGEIVYLERGSAGIWAVGETDLAPYVAVKVGEETVHVETPMYWSAERASTADDRDIMLRSVAITHSSARIAAQPLRWFEGSLDNRGSWQINGRNLDGHLRGLIERAAKARHKHGPLVVHGDQPAPDRSRVEPTGPLLVRSAQTLDVHERARQIELLVVPYNAPAAVAYQGRMVTEMIAPGAFDDVPRQTNRIAVNRDHVVERTVGRATAFYPHDPRGLRADVRIANTPLGDETLELAAEGCLDASAAFRPANGGMRWHDRDAYTLTKGWLGHIAMTPDPAYQGAKVLAVRALR